MTDQKRYFYNYKTEANGVTGDMMPFYYNGKFHIFHIAHRNWGHIVTTDFVNFEERGIAIEHGTEEEPDCDVYTGSIIEKDGIFHAFYCGHNNLFGEKGMPTETMLHATSTDLDSWEKDKSFMLPIDTKLYGQHAWRDGFVVYDNKCDNYKMFITAATHEKTYKRWGCIALAVSKDLAQWEVCEPYYAPSLYDSHECPELFEMGGKWYLIFSTYSRWWETHYRISDSPNGPWKTPGFDDLFDGRAFYAAKTVSDGRRRFIVGWTAAKDGQKDDVPYRWGGNLTAHEIVQRSDGTLAVKIIREIEESFRRKCNIEIGDAIGTGSVSREDNKITLCSQSAFCSIPFSESGSAVLIRTTIHMSPDTLSAGIVYRAEYPTFDKWCMLRIEPLKSRIYFDRSNKFFNDQYYDEVRPLCPTEDGIYKVKIVAYGSICVMYVNDEVALSVRNYEYTEGAIGCFVEEGCAEFSEIEVFDC